MTTYFKAMVIGGKRKFLNESLTTKLSFYGIVPVVDWHVDIDQTDRKVTEVIPKECTVLILFMDMIAARNNVNDIISRAEAQFVKVLRLSYKTSRWLQEMQRQSFEPINPNTAEALREQKEHVKIPTYTAKVGLSLEECEKQLIALLQEMRNSYSVNTVMWTSGEKLVIEMKRKDELEVP